MSAENWKFLKPALAVLTVAGVVLGFGVLQFLFFFNKAIPSEKIVVVEKGWNLYRVAQVLEEEGVISSSFWFMVMATFTGRGGVQAGEFRLEQGLVPLAVLLQLRQGKGFTQHRLTVPEGLTAKEIGRLMVLQGLVDAERVLADAGLPTRLALTAPRMEGWLFPDTYFFLRGDTSEPIIRRMVVRGQKVLQREWEHRPEGFLLSSLEVLTLASIIEKETGKQEERSLISGVFHNRLRLKMKLQSDPTVIYGIPDFDGNITRKHLRTSTPYNTYTEGGLPPTPICNPGEASIHAAFHPEVTQALFFVAKGDGSHVFSNTFEEHEANVDRYQRQIHPKKQP